MLRLVLAEISHRRGRALALVAGIAVATASFTVLTGASEQSRLEVRGDVARHFDTGYDLLVRPRGAVQPLERREGLVQQGFASGIFGGISMAQWHAVQRTAGVEVAAPLAVFGYVLPNAAVPIRLRRDLRRGTRTAFRVRTSWTADHGTVQVRDPDSYVYVTRRPLRPETTHVSGDPVKARAMEDLGDAGLFPVCPIPSVAASAFSTGARSWLHCWSTRTGDRGRARSRAAADAVRDLGATTYFPVPLLLAGVDPEAEVALTGADRAMTSGRWLRSGERVAIHRQGGYPTAVLPVVATARSGVDLAAHVEVRRLPARAGDEAGRARLDRGAFRHAMQDHGPGTIVRRRTITAAEAHAALLEQLRAAPVRIDAFWPAGPSRYRPAPGTGPTPHLQSVPVRTDRFTWGSAYGWTGNDEGFVNAPITGQDVGFRRFRQHIAGSIRFTALPTMRAIGTFDPQRMSGGAEGDAAPLDPFHASSLPVADARSRRALGARTLAPDGNMAGYAAPAPGLLTTLDARRILFDRNIFSNADEGGAAPISLVRVRVRGVTGADATSRERLRVTAERITAKTGLQVDVTAGSSPTSVLVDLPASKLGRPAVTVRERWIKKGVATAILTAVDRKSLILFGLVLLVCALFCVNATSAAVRSRATDLAVLACVGWPARRLWTYLLAEVALIGVLAGVAGVLVALPAGALLDLPVSTGRALATIPAAVLLAVAAGVVPAARAARSDPLQAVRPAVRSTRSAHGVGSILALAAVGLVRVPGRTVLATLSLGVGVLALTVLLAVTFAFRGAVVGTVLGDAVAVQVRTADYVAVAATLALGAFAVADVLYLNLRDRAGELATLRATGWRERHLTRLIALEGAGLGLLGGVGGATLGLVAAGLLAGEWTATMVAVAAAGSALAVVLAVLASIVPAAGLRRLPTATLLAEE